MRDWPAITDQELRARLTLSDAAFRALVETMAGAIGPRAPTEAIFERALGYPWARPAQSFVLTGDHAQELATLDESERAAVLAEFGPDARRPRYPLLAFGSNGAPATLTLKFGHLADEQRRVLVVAGDLHDFDVGAAAAPTHYGAFPATIFPSPGTAVRASVLWVTQVQFAALCWTEISYTLGRLDGVRFSPDDGAPIDRLLAFASRWGALCVDGAPIAMAAVPATGRTRAPYTQEQVLDLAAGVALGGDARARELVSALMEDFGLAVTTIVPLLAATAQSLACDSWTPFRS